MPSKLRIAVWYNLPSGGAKRALNDHVRGLKARGHTLVAWRPPVEQLDYMPIGEAVEERETPLDVRSVSNRGQIAYVRHESALWAAKRVAMREHSKAVAREIDAGGFDVLFAANCVEYHAPWVGRYVAVPKALYLQEPKRPLHEATVGLPWVALPEESGHSSSPAQRLKALKMRLKNDLDVHALRRVAADELENAQSYDRILVNSNFSRESVLRAYNLESTVCYLGVDAERFENRGVPREPFVVSVGAFNPLKGPEFVVRAIGTIGENRPPLVWVANSVYEDERERLQKLAQELGVDLRIRQYAPDSELLDLLNRASAMAYAPRLEPFGYAPLEGNACGLPAVVVSEGGVKETVVDGLNGIVVPHRPEAMGAAIAGLLSDPEQTREMGVRAAAHVREVWSLERATEELERNLLEVVARKASSVSRG